MQNYFQILSNEKLGLEYLRSHNIDCFNHIFEKYPDNAKKIVRYINECYNYKSPYLVEEKIWETFLRERFDANEISLSLEHEIINLKNEYLVFSIDAFLDLQKAQPFQTLTAKENLRMQMIKKIQEITLTIAEKKSANDLISELDEEINSLKEQLRQEQKVFGNYKGFDAVKKAKQLTVINIANL